MTRAAKNFTPSPSSLRTGTTIRRGTGRWPTEQNPYADQISAIRSRGGDVIVSFGGEAGKELAIAETNAAALEAEYQSIIDRYKLTWLDFDIRRKIIVRRTPTERRNAVLARLQSKNPGLIVSYTLPVDPDGISNDRRTCWPTQRPRA